MLTTDIDITQWVTASAVLIVMLYLFAVTLRYISHKQPQTAFGMKRKRLKLVETLHLDARNKICIVEIDDTQEMVISVGLNGTQKLKEQAIQHQEKEEKGAA